MTPPPRPHRLAAVALVAALGLSGCSGEGLGPDVAAEVGSEQVPASRLVELTDEVVEGAPVTTQVRGDLQRNIVGLLVQEQVYDAVAADLGVSVPPGQVDAELRAVEESGQDVAEQLRTTRGVPPSFLPDYVRLVLLQEQLVERAGGQTQLRDLLVAEARELDVTVNPRLGEFDPETFAVQPLEPTLSSPAAG